MHLATDVLVDNGVPVCVRALAGETQVLASFRRGQGEAAREKGMGEEPVISSRTTLVARGVKRSEGWRVSKDT